MLHQCHKHQQPYKPQGEECIGKYAVKGVFIMDVRWTK